MSCKSFIFFIALLTTSAGSIAQDSLNHFFRPGGAVMMAVKTKEGIVMVSDSRLAYRSVRDSEVLAYQDGVPKIFPLKKFALGICGAFSDGTTLIKKIIGDFERTDPVYRTPEECLYQFGWFAREKYPAYFKSLSSSILLCAGYGPEPMLAILMNAKTYSISQDTWASNVFYEIDSLHLINLPNNVSSKQAAETAANTLKEYIKIYHKENESGGLFSVLKIYEDNSWKWLKNDFSGNDYLTECEAAKAIYDKKIKLEYTSGDHKKMMHAFVKTIRKNCP